MEELIELLKQIQDLAGAGIDALESVTSGGGAPKGGPGGSPESGPGGSPEGGPGGPPEGGPSERRR